MKGIRNILINDKFILGLIIINSIVIFMQGFDFDSFILYILLHTDNAITLIFLLEIVAKIDHLGYKRFIKSNWNKFDAILVVLALPSLFFWLIDEHVTHIDFFLILRITRIFKFFRFIRFFPNINHLMDGINQALKTSLIVLLGFFIYNLMISVLSCFFYRDIAPDYFANPLISFYSIFKVFTVEGWYEIPDHIAANSSETVGILTRIYFIFILITGGIFGLSLVNSIFVDAMVSDNTIELEKKVESLEKKIDKLLDNDKTGKSDQN